MELHLTNQRALVTGGTRGLGLAITRGLLTEGVRVAVAGRRTTEEFRAQFPEVAERVIHLPVDLAQLSQVETLVTRATQQLGGLDILVNNAGVWPTDSILETSTLQWQATVDLNLTAPFVLARDFARHCLAQTRGGVILNIVSQAAFGGATSGHAHYAAAKAALVNLTRSMTRELAVKGIRVNALAPGMMATDMSAAVLAERGDHYRARIPLGRIADPAEVADVAVFLCSPRSAYVAGATLDVSGGMLLH